MLMWHDPTSGDCLDIWTLKSGLALGKRKDDRKERKIAPGSPVKILKYILIGWSFVSALSPQRMVPTT